MGRDGAGPAAGTTEVVGTAIPILPARDLAETVGFFRELGFDADERAFADYAVVRRGAIELHFAHTPDLDPWTSVGMAFIRVDDVGSLYGELRASQAVPATGAPHEELHRRWDAGESIARLGELADRPWGMREFALIDPNNNLLRIGQALP